MPCTYDLRLWYTDEISAVVKLPESSFDLILFLLLPMLSDVGVLNRSMGSRSAPHILATIMYNFMYSKGREGFSMMLCLAESQLPSC